MSGVRNLRAMFEQKGETSPPDRGRSPGIPLPPTAGTETPPRPLSKVRTSFIAVEKDGRIGLRRDPSNESSHSLSQRRLSVNTEGESPALQEKTNMAAEESSSRSFKTNVAAETIPESPRQPDIASALTNGKLSKKLGALSDHPSTNPDKHVDVETPTPELQPGDPRQLVTKPLVKNSGHVNGTGKAKAVKTAPVKEPSKAASKQPAKLGPISTIATTKASAKSPTLLKTPTSPAKAADRLPVRTPEKSPGPKSSVSTPKQITKLAGSTASGKKPTPIHISPASGTGFVKPKPKSPTRPVRLPASLMAPTASSVSKVRDAPRESLSRASGNFQVLQSFGRSPSRASISTVATTATGQNLKRQKSTINRPRPSIGPPPKKTAQDHPVTKAERQVDEGFLARMMRPTQASNSKLAEKTPVTPPRKVVVKKEPSATKVDSTKKHVVAKTAAAGVHALPQHSASASTKEVAPEVTKTETTQEAVHPVAKAEEPVQVQQVEEPELDAAEPPVETIDDETEPEVEEVKVAAPESPVESTIAEESFVAETGPEDVLQQEEIPKELLPEHSVENVAEPESPVVEVTTPVEPELAETAKISMNGNHAKEEEETDKEVPTSEEEKAELDTKTD